jgi:hypothetical protein
MVRMVMIPTSDFMKFTADPLLVLPLFDGRLYLFLRRAN